MMLNVCHSFLDVIAGLDPTIQSKLPLDARIKFGHDD